MPISLALSGHRPRPGRCRTLPDPLVCARLRGRHRARLGLHAGAGASRPALGRRPAPDAAKAVDDLAGLCGARHRARRPDRLRPVLQPSTTTSGIRSRWSRCGTAACPSMAASAGATLAPVALRATQPLSAALVGDGGCRRADRPVPRPHREFHQAGAVGPSSAVPWAMVFPGAGPSGPRAIRASSTRPGSEGVGLFLVLRDPRSGASDGRAASRAIGYGLARIIGEFFREPDPSTRFPVRRRDHGHAAVAAADRPRASLVLSVISAARRGRRGPPSHERARGRAPARGSSPRAARSASSRYMELALGSSGASGTTGRAYTARSSPAISSPHRRSARCSASSSGFGAALCWRAMDRTRAGAARRAGPRARQSDRGRLAGGTRPAGFPSRDRLDLVEISPVLQRFSAGR